MLESEEDEIYPENLYSMYCWCHARHMATPAKVKKQAPKKAGVKKPASRSKTKAA